MSEIFCSTCGHKNTSDAIFCSNCGDKLKQIEANQDKDSGDKLTDKERSPSSEQPVPPQRSQQPPQYYQPQNQQPPPQYQQPPPQYQQPPPQYQQPPQYYQPQYQQPFPGYQQPDYIRPPDYVFTTSIWQRIIGTLKRDIHVVEEIEERKDLQEEAIRLLLLCFSIISILSIITVFSSPNLYEIHSPLGSIIEITIATFVGGFVFILSVAAIGKSIGGHRTQVDRDEIVRVTAYAYVAKILEEVLFLFTSNPLGALVWIFAFFYFLFVMIFVIRRALDTGYFVSIITSVISVVISLITEFIVIVAMGMIIETYSVI